MNKQELSKLILGTEVEVPKFYESLEHRILDKCLVIINGLEEEIRLLKEAEVKVLEGISMSQNLEGCKVVVIGVGENNAQLIEHLQRAKSMFPKDPVIGVIGNDPSFPEMPERPPLELLIERIPDLRDTFYDVPKRKGHERPFKYHR